MEITLKPEHEELIASALSQGQVSSVAEAVAEALELWRHSKETDLEELRQAVQEGFDQIDRGKYVALRTLEDYRSFAAEIARQSREERAAEGETG